MNTFVIIIGIIFTGLTNIAHAEAAIVTASFPTTDITRILLRSSDSKNTIKVDAEPTSDSIKVTGIAMGGAQGYHPTDPNWKETPPTKWGLGFVAQRYGTTLVISSKNEIQYIHHVYWIKDIRLELPSGISVVREVRELNGEGAPNLTNP